MTKFFASPFLTVTFLGCTSYLTSSENVSNAKQDYDKILVLGRSKDNTARLKFENQVVAQLKANGIEAIASYTVDGTKNLDRKFTDGEIQNVKSNLVSDGFDGVIITNLVNAQEYTDVIPGNVGTTYIPARYGRFGRYYAYYPMTTWEPDQLVSGVKYVLESSLYDIKKANGDNLQWVGRFELKDPGSIEKTSTQYAKELVGALLEESINVSN
ncbi:MAG: hypothetical protein AAFX53_09420 [Bacteroidota bacterium]